MRYLIILAVAFATVTSSATIHNSLLNNYPESSYRKCMDSALIKRVYNKKYNTRIWIKNKDIEKFCFEKYFAKDLCKYMPEDADAYYIDCD